MKLNATDVTTVAAEVATPSSFQCHCFFLPEARLESPCPAGLASPSPSSAASALKRAKRISITHHHLLFTPVVCVSPPLVILRTRMIRMMVGLMGREAFRSISSRVIPMMDSSTMARSNWFHLNTNTLTQPQLPVSCVTFRGLLVRRRHHRPLLEEASQAKGDEFEDGLDDKNEREDVIAVLENLLEVLRDAKR